MAWQHYPQDWFCNPVALLEFNWCPLQNSRSASAIISAVPEKDHELQPLPAFYASSQFSISTHLGIEAEIRSQ